ncbi:PQQ-binding-like beta-propeller repeat protein [Pseudoalteromonas rubra]|uniref:Pyrrolo-quinoline quinone repeat domain-containing protein n=1 Tax=Pseudoalteromonas rubra TaxID=43658 RepID=A0A5S3X5W8_9GAMM|nr:PQQ-binding-like beta-propeller repeat protein [Pseudoalteromonas rubra]TMP39002.1 hypothetical protein CWB98_04765 [Pseudoalteromonas rubra]
MTAILRAVILISTMFTLTACGGGSGGGASTNIPSEKAEQLDTDGDGIADNTDTDDDNDGVEDTLDAFPLDAKESVDTDADGIGNNADNDDDNDGVEDANDAFPLDPSESVDSDGDGVGNNKDVYPFDSKPVLWSTFQQSEKHRGSIKLAVDPQYFSELWSVNFSDSWGSEKAFLTASERHIFRTVGRQLYTLDAHTGDELWSVSFSTRDSLNPPAYANGKVYVQTGGHENSYLWAFDEIDGSLIFNSEYGNQWSEYYAPTIENEIVYMAGGYYGGMYAFNGSTGNQLWFKDLSHYDKFTPAISGDYAIAYTGPELTVVDKLSGVEIFTVTDPDYDWRGWSTDAAPVIGNQNNVIGYQKSRLVNFDLERRNISWALNGDFEGDPAVSDAGIYIINDNQIVLLDEVDGSILWRWPAENATLTGHIIPVIDHIFVSTDKSVELININTKQVVWRYGETGTLALSNGILYISSSNRVHAIDLEGDRDHDGLPQWWERRYGLDVDPASDQDGDGLSALQEYAANTSPVLADTDGDGLSDSQEINEYGTSPIATDSDGDGLSDSIEILKWFTNPLSIDSDNDGIKDQVEINAGLNPNDMKDATLDNDNDGYTNAHEVYAGSDLNDAQSIPVIGDWGMVQGNASHNGYQAMMLNAADFTPRWTQSFEYSVSSPAIAAGQVFVTGNGRVMSLDITTGAEQWFNDAVSGDISAPSFGNDLVYVHTGGHEDTALWAFNAQTGEQVFRGEHGSQWPTYSAPTIFKERAYMNGGYFGGMQSFNALTGEYLWEGLGEWSDNWEPAVNEDYVLVPYNGDIKALDHDNGDVLFSIKADEIAQTVVLGSQNNVITYGNTLASYDIESQKARWTSKSSYTIYQMPAVGNGLVVVVHGNELKVFDEFNGELVWDWMPDQNIESNIVLTASHIFAASFSKTYALNLRTKKVDWEYDLGGQLSLGKEGVLVISSGTQVAAVNVAPGK